MKILRKGKDWKVLADKLSQRFSKLKVDYIAPLESKWNKNLIDTLARIETEKVKTVTEMITAGRVVFADPQFGLDSFEVKNNILHISLRPTNYFYAALDVKAASMPKFQSERIELGRKFYGNDYALFGRVLAVNSVIELGDGSLLMQFRGPEHMDYRLTFHNVGGHPKSDDRNEEGKVTDWQGVMKTQTQRELGILKDEIKSVELIGLAENIHTHKPDLLYVTHVNLTKEEITKRKGPEDWEQMGKIFIDKDEIVNLLKKNQVKGEIYFPKGTPTTTNYLGIKKLVKTFGLDPTTSNNFCPVGEACLVLYLQMKDQDLSGIYQ